MAKSIAIRIDDDLKQQAETMLDEIGLNMTTYVVASLKALIREQGVPFELKSDPFYSKANQERLRRSIAQMEATGGTVHELPEADEYD